MLKNALSAKAVASLKAGKHRDGEGLQFEVKGGSRRWTFSYMFEGRQRELAIGRYPAVSVADARAKRAELRDAKDRGIDPRAVLAGAGTGPARPITFRQDMGTFIAHMRGQWTPAHRTIWEQSMERIAGPLMDTATAGLTQSDVLSVIRPVWEATNETARRVLGRIEQTIEHAMAVDPRRFSGANPCNNALRVLPRVAVVVRPRPAMPWRELPGFFAELRQRPETAARALELLLLACCPRTGEVIPATWGEINGNRWNVPAAHMKSGVARTIPLSAAAMALLDSIMPAQLTPDTLIFGSRRRGGSGRCTDGAMQTFLRQKMGLGYTVHGFRSSFMDWVAEIHPDRLMSAERALDHEIGNRVQRAYLRSNLLEQRRQLAELWTAFLTAERPNRQAELNASGSPIEAGLL